MQRFTGKTAIVTGGGGGIGAAIARRLLAEGARVAIMDLNTDAITAEGHPGLFALAGDCTAEDTLEEFHAQVLARFGTIDILVNNLGQSGRARSSLFNASSEEVWRFVMEISLFSAMRMSRLVTPMLQERGGRIINMSSLAAFSGDAGLADYAAAKMGVIGFTRALSRELAGYGVTVNVVAPGAIRTAAHDTMPPEVIRRIIDRTPAGFVGAPEDVAAAVAFLASDEARFITGQTLLIDGGAWML